MKTEPLTELDEYSLQLQEALEEIRDVAVELEQRKQQVREHIAEIIEQVIPHVIGRLEGAGVELPFYVYDLGERFAGLIRDDMDMHVQWEDAVARDAGNAKRLVDGWRAEHGLSK